MPRAGTCRRPGPRRCGLAERAARIALLANDDDRAADALRLWRRARRTRWPCAPPDRPWPSKRDAALRRASWRRCWAPGPDGWRYALAALGSGGSVPTGREAARRARGRGRGPRPPPGLAGVRRSRATAGRAGAGGAHGGQRSCGSRTNRGWRCCMPASCARPATKPGPATSWPGSTRPPRPRTAPVGGRRIRCARRPGRGGGRARARAAGRPDLRLARLAAGEGRGHRDALGALYAELLDASSPDPARRLLLGQIAEYLERRGCPGVVPQRAWRRERWQARRRSERSCMRWVAATRPSGLHELQADAAPRTTCAAMPTCWKPNSQQDRTPSANSTRFARGLAGFPDDRSCCIRVGWPGTPRRHPPCGSRLPPHPRRRARQRGHPQCAGLHAGRPNERYTEALELIDRARVAEPDNAAIVDSYGWVLYRLGRNEEALVRAAPRLDPGRGCGDRRACGRGAVGVEQARTRRGTSLKRPESWTRTTAPCSA